MLNGNDSTRKVVKRISKMVLALALVVGLLPASAFAFDQSWPFISQSNALGAMAVAQEEDANTNGDGLGEYDMQLDGGQEGTNAEAGEASDRDTFGDEDGPSDATGFDGEEGQDSSADPASGGEESSSDMSGDQSDDQGEGQDEGESASEDEGSLDGNDEDESGESGMSDEGSEESDEEGDEIGYDAGSDAVEEESLVGDEGSSEEDGVLEGENTALVSDAEDAGSVNEEEGVDDSDIVDANELDEEIDEDDIAALKSRISDAVLSVMADSKMTTTVKKTELRNKASRASSAIPAEDIIIDDKGRLDLAKATLTNNGVPGLEYATKMGRYVGETHAMKGIWIDNPKTLAGSEISVLPGSFSLRWPNCAEDRNGNRLGIAITVSKIMLRHASDLGNYSDHVMIMSNINSNTNDTSGDYLHLDSVMEALKSTSNVPKEHWDKAPNCGVRMTVSVKFTKANSTEKAAGTYLFMVTDLDQPDATYSYKYLKEDSEARFTESIQLLSGFNSTVYLQQDIPGPANTANPDPGSSLLYVQNDIARFSGTADSKYGNEYRAGLVASSDSEFSFNWWGSHAATSILSRYNGVIIRDKNDPTNSTTDKAVITKTTDASGLKQSDENANFDSANNHGGKRVSTQWRTTDMPWKGNAAYHFSAKPGYRVTKVQVQYDDGAGAKTDTYTGSKLKNLTELTFGNSGCNYACVRNYDIIVTTAAINPGAATIVAKKLLKGRDLADAEFSFGLFDEKGAKLEEVKNKKDGSVTFSKREFTAQDIGVHNFKIREIIPNDAQAQLADGSFVTYAKATEAQRNSKELSWMKDYLVYDNSAKAVSIKVSDEGGSAVVCTVDYGGNANPPAFENEQKEEPKKYGGLRVKKVDASSGAGLSGAQFTVESADGETFTMESNESGLAELPATALIEGSYTVRETRAPDGYTLNEEWRHQFSIERDGQIVDLTKDPCKNSEIPKVALPVTGATGISTLAIACVVMVAAGTFLRRRGSFVR